MNQKINWFPGHIAKSIKEFKEDDKIINVYFIVLDARAPKSSFLESFLELIKNKNILIFIKKIDLVQKEDILFWIKYYESKFSNIILSDNLNNNYVRKKTIKFLNNLLSNNKIKSVIPKIKIIGVPNVGKSSLINVLLNNKKTKVENRAGVTKDKSWYLFDNKFWIMDTPGVLEPDFKDQDVALKLSIISSIKLNVIPIEEVCLKFLELLINKNIDIGYGNNINDIMNNISKKSLKTNIDEKEIYRKILIDYNNGLFGKIMID